MAFIGNYPAPVTGSGGGGTGGGGATGGGSDQIFNNNDLTITTDYEIPADTNALTAGTITLADEVAATITVPNTSSWTII